MKKQTANWSRAALAAAALMAGGALAQTVPPFLNPLQNPAPVSAGLPVLHNGVPATAPAIIVTEVNPGLGQASVGYDIQVVAPTVQQMVDYWSPLPPPAPLPPGLPATAGAAPMNFSILLDTFGGTASLRNPGTSPTAPIGVPLSVTACSITRTVPAAPILTYPCTVSGLGILSFTGVPLGAAMVTGETWALRIDYDVLNPTQRHVLQVDFRGDMRIEPLPPYIPIAQTFAFPSLANTLNYIDQTGAAQTYAIGDIDPVMVRHGAIAAHQPALILQGTALTPPPPIPPAGASVQVAATFKNEGTATSTSLAYQAPGFPAGTAFSACQYSLNGGAWTNTATCTVSGGGTQVNITWPALFSLAPDDTIAIRYDAAMPAMPVGTAANIDHRLDGSAGRWPTPVGAVRGVGRSTTPGTPGPQALLPYAYGQGGNGTQSVPALGPLALGGMGLMVALVPGFVAARRRKAGARVQ